MLLRKVLSTIILIIVSAPVTMAQGTTAIILGTVRDQTGAVLPGVNVQVTNLETRRVRTVVTDAGGRYRVPALELGTYSVQGSLSGFRTLSRSGVVLTIGSEVVVDLAMEVGQVAESVTVIGETPLIETTNAQISGLAGNAGAIQDVTTSSRQIQFGLRYTF